MEAKIDNLKGRESHVKLGGGRGWLTSESSFETISSGAWLMESSCSGDVRAMSTSVRISFKTTSQRLGLLRTFLYLYIFFWVEREREIGIHHRFSKKTQDDQRTSLAGVKRSWEAVNLD